MGEFSGAFKDVRRADAVQRLFDEMVEQSSVVIRKVGVDRKGELSAHRVLSSPRVTPDEALGCMARHTAQAALGRRIVVAQDTTEASFAGRQSRGLGPAGKNGDRPGFFIHAAIAVDADTEAVLGVVGADIWTRDGATPLPRRERPLDAKESQRWLTTTQCAAERLAQAGQCIVVGDRESDIYAVFASHPRAIDLLVRAAQNRALADGTLLFAAAQAWPILGEQCVRVASRGIGDRGREARVSLRAGAVRLRRPHNGGTPAEPPTLGLTLVEATETDPPAGVDPLHWRLLTTLPVHTAAAAADIVRLYRLRWRIEQTFRMLKSDGLRLEETQTATTHRLFNLAALALGAAVRIIQLVDARDGSSRPATDVATAAQIEAAKALCPTLEGSTPRQRNPHRAGSLAWISWVVARLGGWNCYYKPPGPKTMRDGWQRFAAIAEGYRLNQTTTANV